MEIRSYNIFLEIQFKTYRDASHQILIQFLDIKRIYDSFKFKICKIIVNIFITKNARVVSASGRNAIF